MGIWVGLDPGENTGMAVWDGASRTFLEVATLPLWQALERVGTRAEQCKALGTPLVVVFEDARKRTWFPREKSNAEYRGRLMGAGAAKRDAKIWEEYLTAHGIAFEARKPQPGMTKWDADYWMRITGWTGRTSNHARDAALLVFERK